MFVRFRQSRRRLQASLIETHWAAGKVKHEHIASLGSVDIAVSVRERLVFWGKLPDRLAKLGNRINAEDQAKILGALHARIPMVTPDEQRSLQLENAKADEQLWTHLRDADAEQIEGHKGLIRSAEQTVATRRAAMIEAEAKAMAAKERRERIERGEDVAGGLGKPLDVEKFLDQQRSKPSAIVGRDYQGRRRGRVSSGDARDHTAPRAGRKSRDPCRRKQNTRRLGRGSRNADNCRTRETDQRA